METLTAEQGNNLIYDHIKSGQKFAVSRVGITELIVLNDMINGTAPKQNIIDDLRIIAGFYKSPIEDFYEEYTPGVKCSDFQIVWKGTKADSLQEKVFQSISPNSIKIGHRAVEPFYFENPWSLALENKRVLIVSPFSQSIMYQSKRFEKIWKDKKILPKFELEAYGSVQSIGNEGPHRNWKESLNIMKEEISKLDFDIALLGCGAYGMPLVSHIKNNMGRSAIYVGGALQIMFGIRGMRWDGHDEIKQFFNENWKRPFEIETPKTAHLAEGGSYW